MPDWPSYVYLLLAFWLLVLLGVWLRATAPSRSRPTVYDQEKD